MNMTPDQTATIVRLTAILIDLQGDQMTEERINQLAEAYGSDLVAAVLRTLSQIRFEKADFPAGSGPRLSLMHDETVAMQ